LCNLSKEDGEKIKNCELYEQILLEQAEFNINSKTYIIEEELTVFKEFIDLTTPIRKKKFALIICVIDL
jgi:hypothetical protein